MNRNEFQNNESHLTQMLHGVEHRFYGINELRLHRGRLFHAVQVCLQQFEHFVDQIAFQRLEIKIN